MTERQRRTRGVREILASIVLGFEVVVVGLGALVAFGLKALTPLQAFLGGGVLIAAMVVALLAARWTIGIWLGSVIQIVVIMSGFIVGAMFFVGAVFAGMWIFALVRGGKIDAQKSAIQNENPSEEDTP